MKLVEIQKKAKKLGIKDVKSRLKKDWIHSIQRKEGNFECFGTTNGYCDQLTCLWREDCIG